MPDTAETTPSAIQRAFFDEETLAGNNAEYEQVIREIQRRFGFHFAAIGLTAYTGAPLRWKYSAGATSKRFERISLAPGHGIGGIVIKAGKPMLFTDIDAQLDPREYSSYPIVFAEDLRSFCALPLKKGMNVVGALLLAFRNTSSEHEQTYRDIIDWLGGTLLSMEVVSQYFISFENLVANQRDIADTHFAARSMMASVVTAQEEERRRISRELHDGIVQELLSVSIQMQQLQFMDLSSDATDVLADASNNISRILDELHNLSVELRPSTLDHFGLVSALQSQAKVYEGSFGASISFYGDFGHIRFDHALETQAYRICQEAMLNACKYSGSDNVSVVIDRAGDCLNAKVIDFGSGFNTDNPEIRGTGCGLPGMRERASLMGGTLTIESSPRGTVVTLVVPLFGIQPAEPSALDEAPAAEATPAADE